MKRVILTPNPYRDKSFKYAQAAIGYLQECGMEVRLCLPSVSYTHLRAHET